MTKILLAQSIKICHNSAWACTDRTCLYTLPLTDDRFSILIPDSVKSFKKSNGELKRPLE